MVDQPTGSGSAFLQRPSTDEIRFAIRQFRMVVESGSGEDFTALIIVTTTLLALAARMKGEQPDDDDVDVPRRSSPEDHAVIQARFSSLYDRGTMIRKLPKGGRTYRGMTSATCTMTCGLWMMCLNSVVRLTPAGSFALASRVTGRTRAVADWVPLEILSVLEPACLMHRGTMFPAFADAGRK